MQVCAIHHAPRPQTHVLDLLPSFRSDEPCSVPCDVGFLPEGSPAGVYFLEGLASRAYGLNFESRVPVSCSHFRTSKHIAT